MSDRVRVFLTALLLVWGAIPASAQQAPTRETQVPLDPDREVLEVGEDLRDQLSLFPDAAGFLTARLFRRDDGTLVLEISRVEGGRLIRERRTLTDAELAALRTDLGSRFAARGQTRAIDRSGRSGLVLTETLLGVGLYGWMIPRGLDVDSDRGRVATYLLTAGSSFAVPYLLTRNASVSVIERNAAIWGSTRGAIHGIFVGNVLNGTEDYYDTYEEQAKEERVVAFSVIGTSVAETVLAYQLVQGGRFTEGQTAFYGAAGDVGIPVGLGLAYVAGLFNQNVESCQFDFCTVDEYGGTPQGYGTALAISLASPWLASLTGQADDYTVGDARALRSFALLGAQTALVPAWALWQNSDTENDRATVAAVLAGTGAGLWIGNEVLKSRSLSGGDGLLVMAGHLAGGLGALGITYLLDSGSRNDDVLYIGTSAAGSLAGALLTLRAVSNGRPAARSERAGVNVEVTPIPGILAALTQRDAPRTRRAPLVTIRF